MSRFARRAALSAVVVGILIGLGGALVIPTTRSTASKAPAAVASADPLATAATPSARGVRVAKARPEPSEPGRVLLRLRGSLSLEARTSDLQGGPDWALRTFLADRVVRDRPGGPTKVIQEASRCVQLGRLLDGRFGWIDATNTFRPVAVDLTGTPTHCGSRLPDARRAPHADLLVTLASTADGGVAPRASVLWGLAGSAAQSVTLSVGRQRAGAELGKHGTFLRLGPAGTARAGFRAEVRYPTGATVTVPAESPEGLPDRFLARFGSPRTGASPVVAARAPDPNGGLPFGLLATPDTRGGWCVTSELRIVGAFAGRVDYRRGTLSPAAVRQTDCRARLAARPKDQPLDLMSSSGGGFADDDGADPLTGRIARRTLRGRTTYSGTAAPDVTRITIATPGGVRTLLPDKRARAFLVVYDGTFPTGETVFTSTLRDGSTVKQVWPASSF